MLRIYIDQLKNEEDELRSWNKSARIEEYFTVSGDHNDSQFKILLSSGIFKS